MGVKLILGNIGGGSTPGDVNLFFNTEIFDVDSDFLSNLQYTLAYTPKENSLMIIHNGIMIEENQEYTLSGSLINFNSMHNFETGDELNFRYAYVS